MTVNVKVRRLVEDRCAGARTQQLKILASGRVSNSHIPFYPKNETQRAAGRNEELELELEPAVCGCARNVMLDHSCRPASS